MKLNFRSLKRKLFGSSPGKKKKKRSSGIRKKVERIVSIILVVFMSMSLVSLVGPTDIFDNDSGPKKTTTASTTVNPDENSVLGLRRFKESVVPDGNDYDVGKLVGNESYIQNVWDTSFIEINPITKTIEDITVTVLGFTTFFVSTNSTYPDSPLTLVKTHISEGDNIQFFTTSFADIISGNEILPSLANGFDVLSTANSTVDEWLLVNTEELIELKAGTYRINDFVNIGSNQEVYYGVFETPFICETTVEEDGVEVTAKFMGYIIETNPTLASPVLAYCGIIQFIVDNEIVNETDGIIIKLYANGEWYSTPITSDTDYASLVSTLPIDMFQNVAITSDTTFTNYAPKIYNTNFGDWFIANTNYIEVNSTK